MKRIFNSLFIFILFIIFSCQNQDVNKVSDKSEDIEKRKHEPYRPYGLSVNNANWTWEWEDIQTLKTFNVTLTNNTAEDFQWIKYRVEIFTYK